MVVWWWYSATTTEAQQIVSCSSPSSSSSSSSTRSELAQQPPPPIFAYQPTPTSPMQVLAIIKEDQQQQFSNKTLWTSASSLTPRTCASQVLACMNGHDPTALTLVASNDPNRTLTCPGFLAKPQYYSSFVFNTQGTWFIVFSATNEYIPSDTWQLQIDIYPFDFAALLTPPGGCERLRPLHTLQIEWVLNIDSVHAASTLCAVCYFALPNQVAVHLFDIANPSQNHTFNFTTQVPLDFWCAVRIKPDESEFVVALASRAYIYRKADRTNGSFDFVLYSVVNLLGGLLRGCQIRYFDHYILFDLNYASFTSEIVLLHHVNNTSSLQPAYSFPISDQSVIALSAGLLPCPMPACNCTARSCLATFTTTAHGG